MNEIYLDNAATTPVRREVRDAMRPFLEDRFGNPSSVHRWGREARAAIEEARDRFARVIGAHASEIVFTRGGTEADNLGLLGRTRRERGRPVVVSPIEHKAVLVTARAADEEGNPLHLLRCDPDGLVDTASVTEALTKRPAVVAVMWVNNEIGVVQPVAELARLCGEAGVPFMTDAVQAQVESLEAKGRSTMIVGHGHRLIGILGLADKPRLRVGQVLDTLRGLGVEHLVMLTGDHQQVADNIAAQVGLTEAKADLMPEQKLDAIRELERQYEVIGMVGDGVNDAPALAAASVGIAMGGAGTAVALETADLVLMGDRLRLIEYAIDLSRKARRVVWQNITFSILVIVVLVVSTFAVSLPLPLGVLGHEGSTVIVVLNGLLSLLIIPEIQRRRQTSKS